MYRRPVAAPSPLHRFRDCRAWERIRQLRRLEMRGTDMADIGRSLLQLGRNLPSARTHDKDWLTSFGGYHAGRRHEIGVIRYHRNGVEQPFPCVIQKMGCEIHIRSFFLHGREFGQKRVREGGRRLASFPAGANWLRIAPYGQRLGVRTCDGMIACRQRRRSQCVDSSAGDWQVGERPPYVLGEKAPEMHFDFRQRAECAQIGMLASWRPGVRTAGNISGEVKQPVDCVRGRQQQPAQFNRIQPLERRPPDRAVLEIEAVNIDPRSHAHPPCKRQGPLRGAGP